MEYANSIAIFFIGIFVGGNCVWLFVCRKIRQTNESVMAASQIELATLAERIQSREDALRYTRSELETKEEENKHLQARVTSLREAEVQLSESLRSLQKRTSEKMEVLELAQEKLSDAFASLASKALKSNSESFLALAKTTLENAQATAKGDLEKRQQAITDIVTPVRESLDKVDEKIQGLEKARIGAYEGLNQQVKGLLETQKELRGETSKLVKALRTPSVRGRWGEMTLKRVVELAGMVDYCDFYEQAVATNDDDKRLRPDLLVRLPAKKNIVVDAKVPLSSYLEAVEAVDDKTRKAKLEDHARQVRAHMASLSKKSYFEQFEPAPEFVILFLPGEVFFSAAVQNDPHLIEVGAQQNVIIATPTTLISLLKAVAYGWRQERLAENAKQISDLGRELYKRLSGMGEHFAKVGRNLDSAAQAYNRAVGSLESRVLVTARRFQELGISADDIDELVQVEKNARILQASELTGRE